MGITSTSKVVTRSDPIERATVVQPGNRDWATTIECVSAVGYVLPPFIILKGKVHQASWYSHELELPGNWTISVSDNGWTTDDLGLAWLKHFDVLTASRTIGGYRLLIINGHSSHATPAFDTYCSERKIITLCMPPHTSRKLQPLDVSCFSPLKTAYGQAVDRLARQRVQFIDKDEFYPRIRTTVFSASNILAGFRATGLVPFCPERVLSTLTVVRTPSPPQTAATAEAVWTTETPHTTNQLNQQAHLIRELLQRQSQSPSSRALAQLVKGCQLAMNSATILAEENSKLRASNTRLRRRENRKRQYIATGGALQAEAGRALAVAAEIALIRRVDGEASQPRRRAPPTCTKCGTQDHNRTSCRNR